MGKGQKKINNAMKSNSTLQDSENDRKHDSGTKLTKDIVLKAFMHCEGCSEKISKCLRGFNGVEKIVVDRENHQVVVKGNAMDPVKVLERLQKKYNKNVELISPKPKPETKQKEDPQKKEQAQVKTVVLNMYIHCEGCEKDIKRSIEKMEGVVSVQLDKNKSHVIVKGAVEAAKLVEYVKKRLGKHAEIIKQQDNKREVKEDGNRDIIMFSYPPQYSTQYLYPNQTFSDENVFACSIM